jgi:hypothetical protein
MHSLTTGCRFERETEQLKSNQAKMSVEETKRLLSEKNFRNKQERDRRVRELSSNNMKKFIDERKRLANKHSHESSLLAKIAKDEEDTLKEANAKVWPFFSVAVWLTTPFDLALIVVPKVLADQAAFHYEYNKARYLTLS